MLSAAQMVRMSRLLDEALELDLEGRRRWLEALSPDCQDLEPALRFRIDGVGNHQVAIRAAMRTTDTPAKLIELRETEVVGAVHEHRVRVGDVESRLHDHRRVP